MKAHPVARKVVTEMHGRTFTPAERAFLDSLPPLTVAAERELHLRQAGYTPTATPTHANPDCEVCGGTGTDPDFHGDCTECWPDEPRTSVARYLAMARQEEYEARRQQATLNRTP